MNEMKRSTNKLETRARTHHLYLVYHNIGYKVKKQPIWVRIIQNTKFWGQTAEIEASKLSYSIGKRTRPVGRSTSMKVLCCLRSRSKLSKRDQGVDVLWCTFRGPAIHPEYFRNTLVFRRKFTNPYKISPSELTCHV